MNPLDFLSTLDPYIGEEVVRLTGNIQFSKINKNISNFLLPNDFHIIYKHISDTHGKTFKNKRIGILDYFKDEVDSSDIEYFMKDHLLEHYMFYILTVLFVGDSNLRNTSIVYMLEQSQTKNTTEAEMRKMGVFTKKVQDMIYGLQESVKEFINSKDPFLEQKIVNFYRTMVFMFNEIYRSLYSQYAQDVENSLKQIGLVPLHWPITYKMRLRLLCELKDYQLILTQINFNKPYFPRTHSIQRKDNIPRLTYIQLLHYMEYLPDIEHKFIKPKDELDVFLNTLYRGDIGIPSPLNAKLLLQQYFVVFLPRWDIVWRKCKWPMNRQLYRNIEEYRTSNELPNYMYWKRILFYQT